MSARKKSDRLGWFKMDAGLFLTDTFGFSAAHVGIYVRLLNLYWMNGAEVLTNPTRLRRMAAIQTDEDAQALQELLDEFFREGKHSLLDTQMEEVTANSKMQSDKAKAADAARSPKVPPKAGEQEPPLDF